MEQFVDKSLLEEKHFINASHKPVSNYSQKLV